jgi:hypothetical protein
MPGKQRAVLISSSRETAVVGSTMPVLRIAGDWSPDVEASAI